MLHSQHRQKGERRRLELLAPRSARILRAAVTVEQESRPVIKPKRRRGRRLHRDEALPIPTATRHSLELTMVEQAETGDANEKMERGVGTAVPGPISTVRLKKVGKLAEARDVQLCLGGTRRILQDR